MAKAGTIFVELQLDDKIYKQKLSEQLAGGQATAKGIEASWRALGAKSDAVYEAQRRTAENAYTLIKNSALSSSRDIMRAEEAKGARLKQIYEQQYGAQVSMLTALKSHWLAVTAIAAGTFGAMSQFINAAAEAEQQEVKLGAALRSRGVASKEVLEILIAQAKAMQQNTIFDDETIMRAQRFAISIGVLPSNLEKVLNIAAKMASLYDLDLNTATEKVALSMQGFGRGIRTIDPALAELMKTAKTADERLELLEKRFGGEAQQAMDTYTNRVKQFKNAWSEFAETLGNKVLPLLTGLANVGAALLNPPKGAMGQFQVDEAGNLIQMYSPELALAGNPAAKAALEKANKDFKTSGVGGTKKDKAPKAAKEEKMFFYTDEMVKEASKSYADYIESQKQAYSSYITWEAMTLAKSSQRATAIEQAAWEQRGYFQRLSGQKTEETNVEILEQMIRDYEDTFVGGWQKGLIAIEDSALTWGGAMEGMVKSFSQNSSRVLSDVFFDGFKGQLSSFSDYWKSFNDALLRTFTDTLARMAVEEAMSGLFGKSGGKGGWLTAAVTWAASFFHEGGMVKPIYAHSGLNLGYNLRADEVPIIAQVGERVLSRKENQIFEYMMNAMDGFITSIDYMTASVENMADKVETAGSSIAFSASGARMGFLMGTMFTGGNIAGGLLGAAIGGAAQSVIDSMVQQYTGGIFNLGLSEGSVFGMEGAAAAGAEAGAEAAAFFGGDEPGMHSGGWVRPDYGRRNPRLKPNEVIRKLEIGEYVTDRETAKAVQGPATYEIHVHNEIDGREVSRTVTNWIPKDGRLSNAIRKAVQ